MKCVLIIFLFSISLAAHSNPFAISFPNKKDLTHRDYIEVQNQIRQVDVSPILREMYAPIEGAGFTTYKDFYGRCFKCINQVLVDPAHHQYPIKKLVKMGKGGDRCFVCCGPLNGKYPYYVKSFVKALKRQHFNGYFLYYIGGWPNPTGEEIRYAAVPYSFKIFAMVEAHHLGFTNVLWVDAACFPLQKMEPLFDRISKEGALLNWFSMSSNAWRYIFPQTRELLEQMTGTDVLHSNYINTIVFGLKMNTPLAHKLVERYYECVRLGTPFFSCFPEEWVLSAIIGNEEFKLWTATPPPKLLQGARNNGEDSPVEYWAARKEGIYFYHRKGR